jgi:hypothetical protein
MDTRKPEPKPTVETPKKEPARKRTRFQVVKLEERIAPSAPAPSGHGSSGTFVR